MRRVISLLLLLSLVALASSAANAQDINSQCGHEETSRDCIDELILKRAPISDQELRTEWLKQKKLDSHGRILKMDFPGAFSTCTRRKHVALTFDDGPSRYTRKVLDTLAEEGVVGTFFVLGTRLDSSGRSLVRRMVDEGHTVGSHAFSHENLLYLSDDAIIDELETTERALSRAGLDRVKYFRPPYGALDDRVMEIIRRKGYKVILWNLDTNDWQVHGSSGFSLATQYRNEISSLGSSIILQHDTYEETVDTLKDGIRYLKKHGYKIVPLSKCIASK